MRISDAEALAERVNRCAASEGLIEEEKNERNSRDVFETHVLVSSFNVGGVLFRRDGGGEVDRRCLGVSKVRRHGYGAVIVGGQAAKKWG